MDSIKKTIELISDELFDCNQPADYDERTYRISEANARQMLKEYLEEIFHEQLERIIDRPQAYDHLKAINEEILEEIAKLD